jgi:hypothetical protein
MGEHILRSMVKGRGYAILAQPGVFAIGASVFDIGCTH